MDQAKSQHLHQVKSSVVPVSYSTPLVNAAGIQTVSFSFGKPESHYLY